MNELDPLEDDAVPAPSGLSLQHDAASPHARSPRVAEAMRQRAAAAEQRAAIERRNASIVGVAVVAIVSLIVLGVLLRWVPHEGWPTLRWFAHVAPLPLPLTGAASGTMAVLGLLSIYEGWNARPRAVGLFFAGAGLLVDALLTAGFFVAVLPNAVGPAAVDAMARAAFPFATLAIPAGLGVHALRKAHGAWVAQGRSATVVFAVIGSLLAFAALQTALGAGTPLAAEASTRARVVDETVSP